MASQFDITPETLEASAKWIEAKANEFKTKYNSIYTATRELVVKYRGEASTTFNQRIEGYRNDFAAVDKALLNYIAFLREYAAKMKATEADLRSKASSLSVGK